MKVFISHSSTDKRFVRKLKDDLNENDIQTWVDEDELDIGDSLSEKLDGAIDDSSHFLIVLSQASVNSPWVQYELEKAIKKKNSNLLQKILPVKYKKCEAPKELAHLLYVDLSNEIREVNGEKITFIGPGYQNFLERLCNAIRKSEKSLTAADKLEIKNELKTDPAESAALSSQAIIRSSYLVIAYSSKVSRNNYTKQLITKAQVKIEEQNARPILLPPLLKLVFKDLKVGDKIFFSTNFYGKEYGHFTGFRKDDFGIVVHPHVRKALAIQKGRRYNVEIDVKERLFTFISNRQR